MNYRHFIQKITLFTCLFGFTSSISQAQYAQGNLFSAARSGNEQAVEKALIKSIPQEVLNQALGAAVVGDQINIIKLLIKHGADVNHISSDQTPVLINALMYDHFKAAKTLIEFNADLTVHGYRRTEHGINIQWDWTPLMCAARKGQLKIVKLLIKKGAIPDTLGWSHSPNDLETAADIAAYSGHLDVLKYLLKKKSPLSDEAIFKAIRGGHQDIVTFLLSKQKDINQLNAQGRTLLMEASWWEQPQILQLIIDRGADVNATGAKGQSALIEAMSNRFGDKDNQLTIMRLLVAQGADVQQANKFSMTPLMRAVEIGHAPFIDLLTKHGAE